MPRIKPITFYPEPDIREWYDKLEPGEGTATINIFIRLVIEAENRDVGEHFTKRIEDAYKQVKELERRGKESQNLLNETVDKVKKIQENMHTINKLPAQLAEMREMVTFINENRDVVQQAKHLTKKK